MRKTNVAASENAYYETDVSNATDAGAVASAREIEIASGSEIASTADGRTGVAIDLNSDMGESFGRGSWVMMRRCCRWCRVRMWHADSMRAIRPSC